MLQRRVFGEGEQFDDARAGDRGPHANPLPIDGDEIVTVSHRGELV
jgi:hypothetical protein